jgi:ElaB/YqjD/DUF883 family membrane-anchored ribosome-binding protein
MTVFSDHKEVVMATQAEQGAVVVEPESDGQKTLRLDMERLRTEFASLKQKVDGWRHDVSERAGVMVGEATGAAKQHPYAVLATAFVAGVAVGALILRR